jgi:hypothetical protein
MSVLRRSTACPRGASSILHSTHQLSEVSLAGMDQRRVEKVVEPGARPPKRVVMAWCIILACDQRGIRFVLAGARALPGRHCFTVAIALGICVAEVCSSPGRVHRREQRFGQARQRMHRAPAPGPAPHRERRRALALPACLCGKRQKRLEEPPTLCRVRAARAIMCRAH